MILTMMVQLEDEHDDLVLMVIRVMVKLSK